MEAFDELLLMLNGVKELFDTNVDYNNEQLLERIQAQLLDYIDRISLIYVEVQGNANDRILHGIDDVLQAIYEYQHELEQNQASVTHDGNHSEDRHFRKVGRPKQLLDEQVILKMKSLNMTWNKIADLHGISTKTLQRRRKEFTVEIKTHTEITDTDLDSIVCQLVEENSNAGERLLLGSLVSMGHRIKRWRLRASLKRVDPNRSVRMCRRRIRRRFYNVSSPNALWHMDGNHKLIRWRFVIHGCIDGYSRTIVFLKCATNNKAETVLENFEEAVSQFRLPLRIRTDHGTENVGVAKAMLEAHGVTAKPVITGKSVHNQRIERLWVDVGVNVITHFENLFYSMEDNFSLDPVNETHLFALHFIFLPRINRMLSSFMMSWNNHPIRTAQNKTPLQLWTEGYITSATTDQSLLDDTDLYSYGIDWNGPYPELQTENHIEVPEVDAHFSNYVLNTMEQQFDPLQNDLNYGLTLFNRVIEFLNETQ